MPFQFLLLYTNQTDKSGISFFDRSHVQKDPAAEALFKKAW
jgi:hypothetical protein